MLRTQRRRRKMFPAGFVSWRLFVKKKKSLLMIVNCLFHDVKELKCNCRPLGVFRGVEERVRVASSRRRIVPERQAVIVPRSSRSFLKCDPSSGAQTKRCALQHGIWMQNLSSLPLSITNGGCLSHSMEHCFIYLFIYLLYPPLPPTPLVPLLLGTFSCTDSAGDCLGSLGNG